MSRRGGRVRAAIAGLAALASVTLLSPFAASGASTLGNPYADGAPPKIPLSTPVPVAQRWLTGALQIRLSELNSLAGHVRSLKALTSADRIGLEAIITSTRSGISLLVSQVASATTIPSLRLDGAAMVSYRVFAVATPQANQVMKTDRNLADRAHLVALVPAVDAAINTERLSHRNVTKARADYRDLTKQLVAVSTLLSGQSSALLLLTASSYPTTSGNELTLAATNNASAGADLAIAHNDVSMIANLLAGSSGTLAKDLRAAS